MSNRSFDLVDNKLFEADFFLGKFESATLFDEINYYFSAYTSSARSVTWALQAVMKDVTGFSDWYESNQKELRLNQTARLFVELRNTITKTGEWPIRMIRFSRLPNGKRYAERFLLDENGSSTIEACEFSRDYFRTLVQLIHDCYKDFGNVIDPELHYTVSNLNRIGKTIEDVEEELGLPRGWTAIDQNLAQTLKLDLGSPTSIQEYRLNLLVRNIPKSSVKTLFAQWLK